MKTQAIIDARTFAMLCCRMMARVCQCLLVCYALVVVQRGNSSPLPAALSLLCRYLRLFLFLLQKEKQKKISYVNTRDVEGEHGNESL